MIDIVFHLGNESIFIRIDGHNIIFANSHDWNRASTIDGLYLRYEGVIKEFPDLKDNPEWKIIAIKRFKDHIKILKNEEAICNYLIRDLEKYGYVAKYKQRQGFRLEKIK